MAHSLFCPVCGTEANRGGSPFASEWAVACHVAGCIDSGHKLHRSWAKEHVPSANLHQTVPRLAEALLWVIHQAIESSRPKTSENPITVLHRFEKKLHQYVQQRLQQRFGVEPEAWWVEGVPLQIRQDCAQRREADPERHELYQYTYLINLKAIVEKNWLLFEEDLARLRTAVPTQPPLQKKRFLDLLTDVNEVRNRHSHPVRAPGADSEQYASDLLLARALDLMVDLLASLAA